MSFLKEHWTKGVIVLAVLAAVVAVLNFSSLGMAPTGPDANEAKARIEKLPLDQRIKVLEGAPGSQAKKDAQIAQWKAEAAKGN
jgi:hypothetical protein